MEPEQLLPDSLLEGRPGLLPGPGTQGLATLRQQLRGRHGPIVGCPALPENPGRQRCNLRMRTKAT